MSEASDVLRLSLPVRLAAAIKSGRWFDVPGLAGFDRIIGGTIGQGLEEQNGPGLRRRTSTGKGLTPRGGSVRHHRGVADAVAVHVDENVTPERLELGEGAWVDVARRWMVEADELFAELLAGVAWQTT